MNWRCACYTKVGPVAAPAAQLSDHSPLPALAVRGTVPRTRPSTRQVAPRRPRIAAAAMAGLSESYSLWLMPSGPLAEQLQGEIEQLAGRVEDAPLFAPHVTLLGGIEQPKDQVLGTAQQLAAELQPYRISFDRVASGKIFHQCVYILCKAEPATMAAGAAARKACGQDPAGPYMPHLSLLYSDISQAEREALAGELQARLLEEGGSGKLADGGLEVDSLAVWYTPGEDTSLESWRLVGAYRLEGKAAAAEGGAQA